ncbi:MAG: transcriptional repressor [Treponema sp.]|nr:transcriptional repressor [Treponema sp.]
MKEAAAYAQKIAERGIRPSIQRIAIYEYLSEHKTHPTADMVYEGLCKTHPSISRTTIYNTLHLFSEHQLVQPLCIEHDEQRYDADMRPHIHFKCTACGNVYDIFVGPRLSALKKNAPPGFSVQGVNVCLLGLCDSCNN